MLKNIVRHRTPVYPFTTLAFCLLGAATGNQVALASEPALPDVNLPTAPVESDTNPVAQLPPPPAEKPAAPAPKATSSKPTTATRAVRPSTIALPIVAPS